MQATYYPPSFNTALLVAQARSTWVPGSPPTQEGHISAYLWPVLCLLALKFGDSLLLLLKG